MSELSFRTMFIGVAIFISLATVSAILFYYNVSVSNAKILNERTNVELEYSKRISMLLDKDTLTGTDVRNLIRYYFLNDNVQINITKIKDVAMGAIFQNVNNQWVVNPGEHLKVISEYNMETINPSYKGKIVENTKVGNIQTINIEFYDSNLQDFWDYSYTGSVQTLNISKTGRYSIELWGASGGEDPISNNSGSRGGKGGYISAEVNIVSGNTLNIYVGGKGEFPMGGYNGGGNGGNSGGFKGGGGGGATDIRYNGVNLSDRILVAGGGGGADDYNIGGTSGGLNDGTGGNGGGVSGSNGLVNGNPNAGDSAKGGTQTTGFALGIGGTADSVDKGGGGGGYYGGYAATSNDGGGGGGSGYISATSLPKANETISDGYTGDGKVKIKYLGP